MSAIEKLQQGVCRKFGAPFHASAANLKIGISKNFDPQNFPINGLRHARAADTTGWYVWSGNQFSESSDFFVPLHVEHLIERCPEAVKYLGLAPGWRFLFAPDHEDVWFDAALLNG
jgi:hypothetical protein